MQTGEAVLEEYSRLQEVVNISGRIKAGSTKQYVLIWFNLSDQTVEEVRGRGFRVSACLVVKVTTNHCHSL